MPNTAQVEVTAKHQKCHLI